MATLRFGDGEKLAVKQSLRANPGLGVLNWQIKFGESGEREQGMERGRSGKEGKEVRFSQPGCFNSVEKSEEFSF